MATFKPFNKKLTPGHPHNKFLMEKFMILKRSADSRHLDNQSSCYRKIIISISKYPMPIVSMEQALMLEGVGQKMAQMVKLMIQQKYAVFMNDSKYNAIHDIALLDEQQTQSMSQQTQICSEFEDFSQSLSQKTDIQCSSIIRIHHSEQITIEQKSLKLHEPSLDSKTNISQKSYKVKKQSAAYYFLSTFEGNTNIVLSKKYVKEQAELKYQYKFSQWAFIKILETNKFIESSKQGFKLMPQGNQALAKIKPGKNKKNKLSSIFQNKMKQIQNRNIESFKDQKVQKTIIKKSSIGEYKLFLVIDSRQVRSEEFKQYYTTKLEQNNDVSCKFSTLSLGDFLWVLSSQKYGQLVLDYIIQRKISSDLSSSIIDGRYKQQRFRLSNSGISNVYYIYEGKYTPNSLLSQKALDKALRSIQFTSNYKIIRTTDIRHTTRYLNHMHKYISNLIQSSQEITTLSTLSTFNSKNIKSNIPINCMLGLMLRCIPLLGKQTAQFIISKFKSIRDIYLCLKELPADERVMFIKMLLQKKSRHSEHIANTLVKIFFN